MIDRGWIESSPIDLDMLKIENIDKYISVVIHNNIGLQAPILIPKAT
jgi:hypothetical protein